MWPLGRVPYVRAHRDDLGEVLADQAGVVQSVYEQSGGALAVSAIFDRLAWERALGDRMFVRHRLTAVDFGNAIGSFDPVDLDAFLLATSKAGAANINAATEHDLQEALVAEDPDEAIGHVFAVLLGARLDRLAESGVTTAANLGMVTAAEQSDKRSKTWDVTSRNPRSAHQAMNGERVPMGEVFSNGMRWPGDPAGGADNNANCQCSVDFD